MEETKTKLCPECNAEINIDVDVCPNCGYPFVEKTENSTAVVSSAAPMAASIGSKKIIGIAMCVLAAILLIIGITRLSNDEYRFYKEHYETCMAGYKENTRTANSYGSGLFNSGYKFIADTYKQMAETDLKEMNKFKTTATICFVGAGILAAAGIFMCIGKKETVNGSD